jgi:hypothetical protein
MKCTADLIDSFDMDSSGNKAACEMLSCLQNQASKYSRGGILTKASYVLTPICRGAAAISPVSIVSSIWEAFILSSR